MARRGVARQERLRFVLVHGAMHDGSCWQDVARTLTRQGHECWTPTLAGHGEEAGQYFTREDCARSLLRYIEEHDLRDFVLAGHSFAGIVLPEIAVKLSGRIRRLVFQSAMIMNDGERIYDVLPPRQRRMFDAVVDKAGMRGVWRAPFAMFRDCFANTAAPRVAAAIYGRLRAVCAQAQFDPVPMRAFQRLAIDKSFIHFTDDVALPPGDYGWLRLARRLGSYRLVQRPGDHEACYTAPDALAEALVEAGLP